MLFDIANVANLPQELKDAPRWVCWKAVARDDGRVDKVPVNPHRSAYNASTTDSVTWGTFSEALGASVAAAGRLGIGFVFSDEDSIFGIDVDHCIIDGKMSEEALEILDRFQDTYIEVSTSGTGYHIYGYGDVEKAVKRKIGEIYKEKRFFTVTGTPLDNKSRPLAECSPKLIDWYVGYITQRSAPSEAPAGHCAEIVLDPDDEQDLPFEFFHLLCDKFPAFYPLWRREGKKYPSASEEEIAVGRYGVMMGWSDQDVFRLMRQWRAANGLPPKHVGALQTTIAVLRETTTESAPQGDASRPLDIETARELLAVLLPLPVARLICLGASDGQYRVVLTNGAAVHLGTYIEMEKQLTWRKLVFEQAKIGMPAISGKKWSTILNALATIAETESDDDSSTAAETRAWIEDFAGDTTELPPSYETLRTQSAFRHGGQLHVHLLKLLRHVKIAYGGNHSLQMLAQRLRLIGWMRASHTRSNDAGAEITQIYWTPEVEECEEAE